MFRQLPSVSCLLMAACCLAIAGCGGTAKPDADHTSATSIVQARQANTPPAHQAVPAPAQLPLDSLAVAKPMAVKGETVPDDTQARRIFASLLSPSTANSDWDQVLEQLLAEGDSAVRVLADRLQTGTDAERELAATTLALLGPQAASASQPLIAALTDPLPFVRANVAATLVQLPDHAADAVPALIKLLQAEDPQLRQMAAVNLNAAGVATTSHVESLKLVLMQDQSEEVLTPVVELLGRIGKPAESALPELQKIAFEQSGELGAAATSAIQLIQGEIPSDTESSAP